MSDTAASSRQSDAFVRIAVRVRDAESGERVAAEAFEAGAAGLEEREGRRGLTLDIYALDHRAAAVAKAATRAGAVAVGRARRIESVDWSEAWKAGLAPTLISSRLAIRPSFLEPGGQPGGVEIAIRPAQAFGTGGHASTALALAWIDELAPSLTDADVVLDVGTGSGVLALATLALTPAVAVGIDLDAVAVCEARENAGINGLDSRLALARGSAGAVRTGSCDLILANLLRREVEPLLDDLARCARPRARAIFSGLLELDCDALASGLVRAGFREIGRRTATDAGGDVWVALLTQT